MQGWKKYQANEVMSINPIKLTAMMFEKCATNMKSVKKALEVKNYAEVEARIEHTDKIINELNMQLNRNEGVSNEIKEHVVELESLYTWISKEIHLVKSTKSNGKIDEVIKVLEDLHEGYRGAAKNHDQ